MTIIVYDPAAGLLTLRGHAGAGEKGRDLVCAALSILAETAAAQPGSACRTGEGWCLIRGADARLGPIALGLRLLARDYPAFVRYREVAP